MFSLLIVYEIKEKSPPFNPVKSKDSLMEHCIIQLSYCNRLGYNTDSSNFKDDFLYF